MHRPVVAGNLTEGADILGTHKPQGDAPYCITDSEGTFYGDARETRNEAKASSPSVNKDAPEASRLPRDTSQALHSSGIPAFQAISQQDRAVRSPHTDGVIAAQDGMTSTLPEKQTYCCEADLPQARGGALSGPRAPCDSVSPGVAQPAVVPIEGRTPVPLELPDLAAVGSVTRGHSLSGWCHALTIVTRQADPRMEAWWLWVMSEAERTQ